MGLPLFLGDVGSGKTLFVTGTLIESKRAVLANYNINIPNYRPLEITDIFSTLFNVDCVIDEAYTWLESRISSTSKLNQALSYILFQSRKRNVDIYLTAQLFSTLDLRFRQFCNPVVFCESINPQYLNDGTRISDFRYEFNWKGTIKPTVRVLTYQDAISFFPFYDTLEIVEPLGIKGLELSLLAENPQKLNERNINIATLIYPKLTLNFTQREIKRLINAEGEASSNFLDIYDICKGWRENNVSKVPKPKKKKKGVKCRSVEENENNV